MQADFKAFADMFVAGYPNTVDREDFYQIVISFRFDNELPRSWIGIYVYRNIAFEYAVTWAYR